MPPLANQPAQNIVNHGNLPPPIPNMQQQSDDPYRNTMEAYFPESQINQPDVQKCRQLMIQLKEDYGYEEFEKNYNVVQKYRTQKKLHDLVNMFAEVDAAYNAPLPAQQPQAAQ